MAYGRERYRKDGERVLSYRYPKKDVSATAIIGITLLSVPDKVFCSMLFNRLKVHVDQRLREEQANTDTSQYHRTKSQMADGRVRQLCGL